MARKAMLEDGNKTIILKVTNRPVERLSVDLVKKIFTKAEKKEMFKDDMQKQREWIRLVREKHRKRRIINIQDVVDGYKKQLKEIQKIINF